MEPTRKRKTAPAPALPPGVPSNVKPVVTMFGRLGMARTWAKKANVMTEEEYRNMLQDRYGVRSAKDLTVKQQEEVLAHFAHLGWGASKPITDSWTRAPLWLKARAVWHALAEGGEIRTDTDDALMAYVKRQTSIEHWRWLNARQCHMIIESLKKWATRKGIALTVDG